MHFNRGTVAGAYVGVAEPVRKEDWTPLATYYGDRCIVTPLNKTGDKINTYLLDSLPGEVFNLWLIDPNAHSEAQPTTPEILNTFHMNSFPQHCLSLKVGVPIILLRNLNHDEGMCNGTRLVVVYIKRNSLRCKIINRSRRGKIVTSRRINLLHCGDANVPLAFYCFRFPVALAFCMTRNKSQGQSLDHVYVVLPDSIFSHGQLYVALSRCTNAESLYLSITLYDRGKRTIYVVCRDILTK